MKFIQSDYKTIQVSFYMLEKDDVKKRVYRFLLAKMLTSHTNKYKNKQALLSHMQDLYGASISGRTILLGNLNLLHLGFVMVNPYIVKEEALFDEMIDLFKDMLMNRTYFDQDIFNHEKRMLIEQWETIKDQKRLYGRVNFEKHFFVEDPFGYPMAGTLEDVKNVTLDQLKSYFIEVMNANDIEIMINGYVKDVKNKLTTALSSFEKQNKQSLIYRKLNDKKPQFIEDYLDMKQALFYIGYHLPIYRKDKLHDAAQCFNLMVGGYAESILFKEIREKDGLCYDIRSSYDPLKGTFTVNSGIDLNRKKEALERFKTVFNHLTDYGFDEASLKLAKGYLIHQFKSSYDDQASLSHRIFFDQLYNEHETMEERIKMIEDVTFSDVLKVYEKLKYQLTYVLSGKKHEN